MSEHFKDKKFITTIIISIILIIGAFFLGRSLASSSNSANPNNFPGRTGGMMQGQGNKAGNLGSSLRGVIGSIDTTSIVIKNQDGSSRIVLLSASTTVSKSVIADISTLIAGDNVMVRGKTNSDGSVTADSIQVFTGQNFGPQGANSPLK